MPYFHCGPSSQKEDPLIYIHMYIYTPTDIRIYVNTDTHIHMYTYVLFKSDSVFDIINWIRPAVPNWRTNIRNCFLSHVCLAKKIFKFRKVISCAYSTIWGKFKNLIQIIRTSVIDKIAGYSIHALINRFIGR